MRELHRYRPCDVLALARAASGDVIKLLGTPSLALLTGRRAFRVVCGTDVAHDPALDDVYSARVFSPDGELRWHEEIGDKPTAVLLLRDRPATVPAGWQAFDEALHWSAQIEQRYLLWGTVVETSATAHRVHEARIRPFEIPATAVAARCDQALQLVSHELLGHADDGDPNTRVVEELLSHLETGDKTWPEGLA